MSSKLILHSILENSFRAPVEDAMRRQRARYAPENAGYIVFAKGTPQVATDEKWQGWYDAQGFKPDQYAAKRAAYQRWDISEKLMRDFELGLSAVHPSQMVDGQFKPHALSQAKAGISHLNTLTQWMDSVADKNLIRLIRRRVSDADKLIDQHAGHAAGTGSPGV